MLMPFCFYPLLYALCSSPYAFLSVSIPCGVTSTSSPVRFQVARASSTVLTSATQ